MPAEGEIFPEGYELSDVVREKEALYANLKKEYNLKDQAFYLSIMISALRCGLIDEKTYHFYSGMGIIDDIPFEIMAFNLRNKLQEALENEFAAMDAGGHEAAAVVENATGAMDAAGAETTAETDQDENGIAECVRSAVGKVEES